MHDPRPCCILEVCCPPGGKKQIAHLMADLGHPFALAEGVEVEEDGLFERLLAKYRLVPRDIDAAVLQGLDRDIRSYLRDHDLALTLEP